MTDTVRLPEGDSPWFETRAGWLFFVNLLLVTPALVVLFPLAVSTVLRGVGMLGPEFKPIFDTIPWVVSYAVPYVGWLSVVPLFTIGRNLRMSVPAPARGCLIAFMTIHLLVLAITVTRWVS